MFEKVVVYNGFVVLFVLVGLIMWLLLIVLCKFMFGCVYGLVIVIVIGFVFVYVGGVFIGGEKGLVDVKLFVGIGLMGGVMLCDFVIVVIVFEV